MNEMPRFNRMPDPIESGGINIESKEKHEFTVEEIRNLLKMIDGKDRPDLSISDKIENIKGELMSMTFKSGELENVEGADREISYQLTLAGQRYKSDGSEGRYTSKTFLTKDYDESMFYSEEIADYLDDKWTNLKTIPE